MELRLKDRLALERLYRAYPTTGNRNRYQNKVWETVRKRLATKTFRSPFRESLPRQVREWADIKAPRYSFPLTPKQLDSIMRF